MLHLHARGIVSLFKGGEAKLSKTCLSVYINFLVIGEEGPSALDQSRQRCCLKHVPIMGTVRISFFFSHPARNVVFNPGSLPSPCVRQPKAQVRQRQKGIASVLPETWQFSLPAAGSGYWMPSRKGCFSLLSFPNSTYFH